MAVKSGFFNSIDDDRLYNADDMSMYFEGLVSDGVYESVGDALIVRASSGMDVTVGTGRALVKMRWLKNTEVLPLTISAADVQHDRHDLIVLRCDLTEGARAVTIDIKEGTPAARPVPQALENSETVKELALARIWVRKGATAIFQSHIADLRGTTDCGFVTGVVQQVDTSQLFLQYQNAFENFYSEIDNYFVQKQAQFDAWFAGIVGTLGVNTELRKYQQVYTFTDAGAHAPLNIPEYETGDILLVHVNGVMLTEKELGAEDFGAGDFAVVKSQTWTRLQFSRFYQAGDVLTIICIKSVIGDGVNSNLPVEVATVAEVSKSGLTVDATFEEVQE